MTGELYFQWQNDVLRKSIYPLREMKLRDFLVYYKEIDLWAEYKNKDIASEINDYHAQKKLAVEKTVKSYYEYRNYFMKEDVRADYMKKFNGVDEGALADIHVFHKTFHTYVPRYRDPRSETYFVSQQVLFWQQVRKDYLKRVASKQHRVSIMKGQVPPHPNVPKEEQELALMEMVAFPMIDEELNRLYAFVSASGRIEKRKLEIVRSTQEALKQTEVLTPQLQGIQSQIEKQEALQKRTSDELARLKSPPELAPVESYFSNPDVSAQVRGKYAKASQSLVDSINGIHNDLKDQLSFSKEDAAKLSVIKNTLFKLTQYQKSIQSEITKHETDLRNMGPAWKSKAEREALRDNLRDVSLKAVAEELNRLSDYQSAFEYGKKSKAEMTKLIQAKEQELARVNGDLSRLRKEAQVLQGQIDAYDDILIVTEEKRLTEYVPDPTKPVTVKDIALAKIEEYKESLAGKDRYQLLELVVQRFKEKPDRYPKWLQYMVIHFSGMRYASAHGSWADPKDLLANLQTSSIDKDLKKMDESVIEALCREKVECYEPSNIAPTVPAGQKPKLTQATDPEWKDRIAGHVKRLERALEIDSTSYQRNALLDLRIDEENYEIDQLKPAEVSEALLSYKDTLPEWMWKEIVKLTDLRVNQVTDPNWEKLMPEQQAGQYSQQDAEFSKIMNDWKQKFITGWREEHDRSDKLIVTRAVCNEVAEHIQHLRGHSPTGGLTPKPTWYQSKEKADPRAYFVKPENGTDYKTGASILWLRFVRKEPNPWQVAHPISTKKGGFGLLPPEFGGKRQTAPSGTTPWNYDRSDPIKRARTFVGENKVKVKQEEWLRWIHEATVVEMAETANGAIVLTFETALPSDDPRLSSIGVFKHYLSDLLWDGDEDAYNRSFVGFVPEGQVPMDNLKDMLDWEKILLKS